MIYWAPLSPDIRISETFQAKYEKKHMMAQTMKVI
jgi:hypothetical protein